MAEYAAECGYSVSQDELESCTIANENPTEEYAAACLEADDPAKLREWWTCEELAENFTNGSK